MAYFRWRRNSIRLNPLNATKASVEGSGTSVIIISPLGEPLGLATPETSARSIIADKSMMEPPPPPAVKGPAGKPAPGPAFGAVKAGPPGPAPAPAPAGDNQWVAASDNETT